MIAADVQQTSREVVLALPEPRSSRGRTIAFLVGLSIVALLLRGSVGLTLMLPIATLFIGLTLAGSSLHWSQVAASAEGIVLSRTELSRFVPWSQVQRAVLSGDRLVLVTPHGPIALPLASTDQPALLSAMPEAIPRGQEAPKRSSLAFAPWIALLVVLYAIYQIVVGQR